MTNRTPRDQENRESKKRHWRNPNQLLDPEPREGVKHRWVRARLLGEDDSKNITSKFREGWEPVPASEYPEVEGFRNDSGNIEYGGLILCRTDQEVVEERNEYYQKINDDQMAGVDRNFLRENDSRMPLLRPERSTKTEFGGRGRG